MLATITPQRLCRFLIEDTAGAEARMQRGLECPALAEEFDRLHSKAPKFGRQNAGAKELAGGYTRGLCWFLLW